MKRIVWYLQEWIVLPEGQSSWVSKILPKGPFNSQQEALLSVARDALGSPVNIITAYPVEEDTEIQDEIGKTIPCKRTPRPRTGCRRRSFSNGQNTRQ